MRGFFGGVLPIGRTFFRVLKKPYISAENCCKGSTRYEMVSGALSIAENFDFNCNKIKIFGGSA